MSAAHTPGPWAVRNAYIVDAKDRGFAEVLQTVSHPSADEANANARLMAAAPDLLGALRALVPFVCAGAADHEVATARAAIAKATGGAL